MTAIYDHALDASWQKRADYTDVSDDEFEEFRHWAAAHVLNETLHATTGNVTAFADESDEAP